VDEVEYTRKHETYGYPPKPISLRINSTSSVAYG